MLSNLKRYHRPKTIPQALALLEKNSGSILVIAGGTKLVPSGNDVVEELVDITELELDSIKEEEGALRIGATTTMQKLVESPVLKAFANGVVSQAALLSHHSKMVRNVATLGGELVTSGPLSVLYCAFLILQAQVRIAGGEEFALAMNIFRNKKQLSGGLLVEVLVPPPQPETHAALYAIMSHRVPKPLICAAARITHSEHDCTSAKIAITGTQGVPQRLHEAEKVLEGKPLIADNINKAADAVHQIFEPVSDELAGAEYRKEVSGLVVKRALQKCVQNLET